MSDVDERHSVGCRSGSAGEISDLRGCETKAEERCRANIFSRLLGQNRIWGRYNSHDLISNCSVHFLHSGGFFFKEVQKIRSGRESSLGGS